MIIPLIVAAGVGVASILIWLDEKKRREEWEQLSDEEKEQRMEEWRQAVEEERIKENKFKRIKGKILRRARHRCENCGKTHRDTGVLNVYYIDDEGECSYDNLRALCDACKDS